MGPLIFLLFLVLPGLAAPTQEGHLEYGTAFFITENGFAVTSFALVGDASPIIAYVNSHQVEYEIFAGDFVNDIAVIQPKTNIKVKPVRLFSGKPETNESITNLFFIKSQDKKLTQVFSEGTLISDKGLGGDIRHLQLQFPSNILPREGPLFNALGLCVGFISYRVTDIYSLLQPQSNDTTISVANKIDYLYPLIKDLPGVIWAQSAEPLTQEELHFLYSESITYVEARSPFPLSSPRGSPQDQFAAIRSKIPPSALFISVTISSGYSNVGFAEILLKQLEENSIGNSVSPALKQKFYRAIYDRFGQARLTAGEVVKMAADLSGGYFLQADCQIVSGSVEDRVHLKLYKPNSIEVLADIYSAKVMDSEPGELVKELTRLTVKKLSKELKAKTVNLFFPR